MAKIDAFFNLMFEQKASDLHLASGNPPILRINGELHRVDFPPLESDTLKAMLYEITPEWQELAKAALTELSSKVHQAATHGDFISNFCQVPYQVIIIEELFAANTAPENRSLASFRAPRCPPVATPRSSSSASPSPVSSPCRRSRTEFTWWSTARK